MDSSILSGLKNSNGEYFMAWMRFNLFIYLFFELGMQRLKSCPKQTDYIKMNAHWTIMHSIKLQILI